MKIYGSSEHHVQNCLKNLPKVASCVADQNLTMKIVVTEFVFELLVVKAKVKGVFRADSH